MRLCFFNARLVQDRQVQEGTLWVEDGKIVSSADGAFQQKIDVKGKLIAPGLIDLQINGAFGIDLSSEPHRLNELARQLPQWGVTSFLPTVITSPQSVYHKILPQLQPQKQKGGSEILGIHLEGPFINLEKSGAHPKAYIQSFQKHPSIEKFYGSLAGVKMVTLAPELPGALDVIKTLRSKNIVISAGHSQASYEDMQKSVSEGLTMATHLFNATAPLHQRAPGIIGEALTNSHLFYSIIADGLHVHPAAIKLAWRANPEGLILISDITAAGGQQVGSYTIGSVSIEVEGKRPVVKGTDHLAGSITNLAESLRLFQSFTDCSIAEALEAATLKPARLLGIESTKGTLKPGADADFIILNEDLTVEATYISGQLAWHIDNIQLI